MFAREPSNPIISPSDVKPSAPGYEVAGAFNPGAVSHNGETVLLLRVAEKCVQAPGKIRVPVYNFENGRPVPGIKEFDKNDPYLKLKDTRGVVYKGKDYLSSLSHIRLARSRDGINFKVEETPFICPHDDDSEYGTEDARVLKFENRYYINYSIVSQDSWCTALSVTEDFKTHKRLGIIFHPENKDVAIFPEKIKGKYAALHRPNNSGFGKPSIWYAESPDLLHWGMHRRLLRPRNTSYESMKIGGGAPPLKTPEGWLCVYHAKGDNQRYSLFPLLLDLEEPWKIIRNPEKPIFEPAMEYERDGFFGNVVFTNGMLEKEGLLYMYYGASDEFSCLATIKVQDLLDAVM